MAGVLDTSRFKYFLSQELNVPISEVDSFVLGGHGDTMVPVPNRTMVSGENLTDLVNKGKISKARLDEIIDRTRNGEYGVSDLYVGVPVVIGSAGIEEVVELDLDEEEKKYFKTSIEAVSELFEAAKNIDPSLK